MNDIIQDLEINATNGKENFCYINEKQLNAMKELSERESKENKQLKEVIDKVIELINKMDKECEEEGCSFVNLIEVIKINDVLKEVSK